MSIFSDLLGSKVEVYKFFYKNEILRVTSSDTRINFNNEWYEPSTIKRSDYNISNDKTRNEIKLTVSSKFEVVDYFQSITPDDIRVEIFQTLRNDTSKSFKIFNGLVKSLNMKKNISEITLQPFASLLTRDICRYSYQTLCNNSLYDVNCKLNIEDFSTITTITDISSDGITFTLDVEDQFRVDNFTNGVLRISETGEARMVIESTHNVVKVMSPFTTVKIGDLVKISVGCNRSSANCKEKFSNFKNYAGFEYIPNRSPFENGL